MTKEMNYEAVAQIHFNFLPQHNMRSCILYSYLHLVQQKIISTIEYIEYIVINNCKINSNKWIYLKREKFAGVLKTS